MSALLTDNLPLLAGAPNGIQKLRELILELAVRGKLVPQNPSDEPASELLKRIAAEKVRLVAEGRIRKQKPLAEIGEEEKPFELPVGWEWARLGELAVIRGGCTPSMSKSEFWDGDIPWVSPKDMHFGDVCDSGLKVTEKALAESSLELIPSGSVLLVGRSGILKRKLPAQLTVVPCTINQDLKAISPYEPLLARYVQLMLLGNERVILIEDVKQGTTVQSLVYEKLFSRLFGLPPLPEQHRIVAKVDELMALCDRLEARETDAASAHARLVRALLDSLTQARDADDFAARWQRLAEHFHSLFTSESSIDALKQTLLQLAVMGKLVPQDPSDEPASKLLKQITEEKAELVKKGRIKAPKSLPKIKQGELPYELPQAWEWVRLGDISEFVNGDRGKNYPNRSEYVSEGIPWINTGHIEADGTLSQCDMHFITREKFDSLNSGKIRRGDLVYCLRGATFGKTAIVDPYCEGAIASSLMIIRPFDPCSNRYMYRYLTSQIGKDQIFRFDNGSAQPNLSANSVRLYVYPLPPLAEQHRIVAKLDQLLSLCDQLKSRLTAARQLHERLAGALVEQAVACNRDKE